MRIAIITEAGLGLRLGNTLSLNRGVGTNTQHWGSQPHFLREVFPQRLHVYNPDTIIFEGDGNWERAVVMANAYALGLTRTIPVIVYSTHVGTSFPGAHWVPRTDLADGGRFTYDVEAILAKVRELLGIPEAQVIEKAVGRSQRRKVYIKNEPVVGKYAEPGDDYCWECGYVAPGEEFDAHDRCPNPDCPHPECWND